MSSNGIEPEKYHLLYESSSDESSNELFNSSHHKKPLLASKQPKHFPVISHDRNDNENITIASKNGLLQVSRDAIPLSKVKSRVNGTEAVGSMLVGPRKTSGGLQSTDVDATQMGLQEEEASDGESFIFRKIGPHDTLQGIALQYRATIAELKRANNLMTDQDFYALKFMKVPIAKHSVLLETHATDLPSDEDLKARDRINGSVSSVSSNDVSNPEKWMQSRTVSINQAMTISAELMQSDLSRVCQEAFDRASNIEHTVGFQGPAGGGGVPKRGGRASGADWGVTWQGALGLMLFICVAIPVAYIIYANSNSPDTQSTNNSNPS